jgi:hypothetical protein
VLLVRLVERKKGKLTMATEKDRALVDFLIRETDGGQIQWEPTAYPDQFTTSFKGKYNVTINKSGTGEDIDYWVRLTDTQDREILQLWDVEVMRKLRDLFKKVQRAAFNVDSAIDDIMGTGPADERDGKGKEDIPF